MNKRLAFHAERFGLIMVDPGTFEIERRASGAEHVVCFADGDPVTDKRLKERIDALVIPPAWHDVKICVDENGHIQAVGRDEKGRLQYRYHDHWVNVRNAVKTERLVRFGHALPKLRSRIEKDLRRRKLSRELTSAVAARLIDLEAMRPGHEKYAEDGGRGVASLQKENIRIRRSGGAVLDFVAKSNKQQKIEIHDDRLVKSLERMRQGRGKRLFRVPGKTSKKQRPLTANLLNEYLREAAAARVSAKDFRTFHGSAEALRFLIEEAPAEPVSDSKRKKTVAAAMRRVSELLRNTPAVARASYVHPEIISAYEEERLSPDLLKGRKREGLSRVETGLMRFLEEVATA
ncbi:DNA topoisomerase IB [Mangrovibrevibacter kandeliae]|uniref:DNA topoisomerase IB n=1 Tax=Mangrovibrevibacter kandeliae TaxID=2968473 RepID=UPI0021195818|nr:MULTISPECIES: DNA topoisomerase IB [unclassified Aurantimonas]MCQ8782048.1 DNA topoisomerase IB [Aurantimonas sp. CSK15Z-1]MCW4115292.1 DNA topoisomerase IB [Aurantimonas sp. MSK8Z-1]